MRCFGGHWVAESYKQKRTDRYGGSFENRTRFLFEVIEAVRAVIPSDMPLWLRISAIEWMEWSGEPSWDMESTIRLAKLLPAAGVDVLDVSSGGNASGQQIKIHQTFQSDQAGEIREALRADGDGDGKAQLLIATVGLVADGAFARAVVQEDEKAQADLVLVGRQFLREPDFVLSAAQQLGVEVKWPHQYHRAGPKPRGQ